MAHAFDSGASLPLRRLIRQQIVAKLAGLLRSQGLYLGSVVELPARFTAGDTDLQEMLVAALAQPPVVAIAIGDREFEARGMGEADKWNGQVEIQVLVAETVNRTELDTVRGDVTAATDSTAAPGVETILEHVFERIAGQRIRTVIGSVPAAQQANDIRPVSEKLAWFGDGWIVFEQLYTVMASVDVNHQRAITAQLLEIETNNNLDGAGVPPDGINPIAPTLTEIPAS